MNRPEANEAVRLYNLIEADELQVQKLDETYDSFKVELHIVGVKRSANVSYTESQRLVDISASSVAWSAEQKSFAAEIVRTGLETKRAILRKRIAESRRRLAQLGCESAP